MGCTRLDRVCFRQPVPRWLQLHRHRRATRYAPPRRRHRGNGGGPTAAAAPAAAVRVLLAGPIELEYEDVPLAACRRCRRRRHVR